MFDNLDYMVDLGRTIETVTVLHLWSVGVTATLFTLFMLWAFYYVVSDSHELSWLGWLAISMSAFGVLGLPFLYAVATMLDLPLSH